LKYKFVDPLVGTGYLFQKEHPVDECNKKMEDVMGLVKTSQKMKIVGSNQMGEICIIF